MKKRKRGEHLNVCCETPQTVPRKMIKIFKHNNKASRSTFHDRYSTYSEKRENGLATQIGCNRNQVQVNLKTKLSKKNPTPL